MVANTDLFAIDLILHFTPTSLQAACQFEGRRGAELASFNQAFDFKQKEKFGESRLPLALVRGLPVE
jgi:hypothetical protein